MVIHEVSLAGALVLAGALSGSRASEAADPARLAIAWDIARATAHGSGCNSEKGDTQFLAFGPDLAVLFKDFGINLKRGDRGPLVVQRQCLLHVPARIPGGAYQSQMTQTITYGVNKSQSSDGSIDVSGSFFGKALRRISHAIRRGKLQDPGVTATKVTDLLMLNACTGGAIEGLYKGTVTVQVRRDTPNEDMILATAGLDLRYDITHVITPCP